MADFIDNGRRFRLTDPLIAPNASAFLWNRKMMLQMSCRGYASAQFMQPEPAKYSHGPTLAAKTFMQPEHPYFSHHPGRFFYLKDHDTQQLMSAPYEPVRNPWQQFAFEPGMADLRWLLQRDGIEYRLSVRLPVDDAVECWQLQIRNLTSEARRLSVYPYFPVGYASWMNMAADVDAELNAIIASSITPYQKLEDYPKQKHFKDLTFLAADRAPTAWTTNLQAFEGEGGLANPDALQQPLLDNQPAHYELPACIQQFDLRLAANGEETFNFLFGPAQTRAEIAERIAQHLPCTEAQQQVPNSTAVRR